MECSSRRQFPKASSAAVTGVTAAAGLVAIPSISEVAAAENRCTEARCGRSFLHFGVFRSECPLFAVFLLLNPQLRTRMEPCPDGEY